MKSDEVQKTGHLAKIAIGTEEMDKMAEILSDILKLVEKLDEADLDDVEPLSHPLSIVQRLREDRVTESNCREDVQSVATQTADGLYLVPKVIE